MKHVSFFSRPLALLSALLLTTGASLHAQEFDDEQPISQESVEGASITKISALQGTGDSSPLVNATVTVRGVVTADLLDEFGGILVQSAPGEMDEDPATSEGLFVKLSRDLEPKVGDFALVVGKVVEYRGITTLDEVQFYQVNSSTKTQPVELILPLAQGLTWESYESMYLSFPNPLVVTDNHDYGRYGFVRVSQDQRLFQPTNFMAPGDEAFALESAYETAGSILLDDGKNIQNPDPLPFTINGEHVRAGDSIEAMKGFVMFYGDAWQLISTEPINWVRTNPRVATPPAVGGDVIVASYNVLNFFNGNGEGGGFPTSRGADSVEEFERQKAKIVAGIVALDADIVGLLEIENDGFDQFSAIAELTRSINERITDEAKKYTIVETKDNLGNDEICNAVIYRQYKLVIIGEAVTYAQGPFQFHRPSLITSFKHKASSEAFTVSLNHFKSKSCRSSFGENVDGKDGQACYNADRVEQATMLVNALKNYPTGLQDDDVIIIGDLNSNASEGPIKVITDAGFHEVLTELHGKQGAYSYVFDGRSGLIDYAILSPTLRPRLTTAEVWHVNTDETTVLDYNSEFKPKVFYEANPFRSSDHDPVIFGLNF